MEVQGFRRHACISGVDNICPSFDLHLFYHNYVVVLLRFEISCGMAVHRHR